MQRQKLFAEIQYWKILFWGKDLESKTKWAVNTWMHFDLSQYFLYNNSQKEKKKSINDQIFSYITFLPNDHNSYSNNNLFFHFNSLGCADLWCFITVCWERIIKLTTLDTQPKITTAWRMVIRFSLRFEFLVAHLK